MEMTYEERLRFMYQLCQAQTRGGIQSEAQAVEAFANVEIEDAIHYLASFLTFKAIQSADRHPAEELENDFEMLGVYQCFGLMVYAFLFMP